MARISLEPPRTLTNRLVSWYSKRKFGRDLGPTLAAGHNRRVLMTMGKVEMGSAKWNALDPQLKIMVTMKAAMTIGCEWCVDFSYWLGREAGLDADKIHAVPGWRNSTLFTPLERLALEYAEAMSTTPVTVTDELVAGLGEHLDDAQLVELTATIALENLYGRNNLALGLAPEGLKEECALPARD
ncbi:carboxymuconolactone decarboxylase family protein [Stackebrandtia nassauensis]|uniref:Carboxymuconolactone decarboxylase n=1 Tax=Stackebrandtia nassauensis (strain DSM 44728 / CIP 108903 / NRRL B-16338 / NBRC 102104 / LLR-40K-21) TaxID=446470 RepID=D3PYS0_STANL|nr:carboxymuconolactone decarboxylase family protein [Stackebrandtia nassauensis]ADD43503.1 Carboxymuconolactone decarboxylase [Stackebrandtia nassauensis DSM 44728]